MPADKDSIQNTLLVATVLCLVCSLLVSMAAVGLKPIRERNIQLDRKNNLLKVVGFSDEEISQTGIEELFNQRFEALIIDFETGEEAAEACKAALSEAKKEVNDVVAEYDQFWASKSKRAPVADQLSKKEDICGIKYREKFSHVFILKSANGEVEKYVFPVRGYGLWSMMQGYLAVEPDFETLAGITFYEQAETPGLGGEVMNPNWKAKWPGKKIFNNGEVAFAVSKGDQSSNEYGVDALSGATITSNGVSKMVKYWLGPSGFGPFIEKKIEQQKGDGTSQKAADSRTESGVTNG